MMNRTFRRLLLFVIGLGLLSGFMVMWSLIAHLTIWDAIFWGVIGIVGVLAGIAISEMLIANRGGGK
jgi:hypothetical protein